MRRTAGKKRGAVRLSCVLAVALATGPTAAQDKDADAERLFREGQKLMEERRYGEACPKFADAYAKDRALGTLINLAFCHKEQGAIWYAWLEFREAEVKAIELNRADRRDFAKQRLAELEKLLPKVVIDNPRKAPLTDVLVEERKVWEAERGSVFAAEAGQRKLTFRAKGKKPATVLFNVPARTSGGAVAHVAVPEMEDGAEEKAAAPGAAAIATDASVSASADKIDKADKAEGAASADTGAVQRTLGWVALGVGGAGVIVGSIAGLMTLNSPCRGGAECGGEEDAARTTGAISTVSYIVGGLAIGGGVALLVTAPKSAPSNAGGAGAQGRAPERRDGLTVTPRIGAGWAGVAGTF